MGGEKYLPYWGRENTTEKGCWEQRGGGIFSLGRWVVGFTEMMLFEQRL